MHILLLFSFGLISVVSLLLSLLMLFSDGLGVMSSIISGT